MKRAFLTHVKSLFAIEGAPAAGTRAFSRTIRRSPDGLPLQVLRPANPEKAVAAAKAALRNNDAGRLASLPEGCGPYRFVGYLGEGSDVVDEHGLVVGRLEAGDSFVTESKEKENLPS